MTAARQVVVAAVGVALALSACAGPSTRGGVPDDVLLEEVAAIPGVVAVDVEREAGTPVREPQYVGTVAVAPDADPACVLDRVWATLWQGRLASIGVDAEVDGRLLSSDDLLGINGVASRLSERYGARTGSTTITPIKDPPACRT